MPDSFCDQNEGIAGLVCTWILLSIGILTVSLRIYVRSGVNRKIGWDDYTAVAGLIVGIVAGGFFTKMITSGMGRHRSCLPPQSIVAMLEFSAISEGINVLGIGIVKISVCLTLLRVVERARRGITLFLRFLLVFVAVTHLALAMLFFLHCRPLAALWNKEIRGSCLSTHTTVLAGYIGFAIDVVTDLVCAAIPVLVIHRLQMGIRSKVALCVLMGLGVFTAGCAVAKAITLRGVFAADYTFGFTKPATWAAVEQFVGIIITSLPTLRPLLRTVREKSHSSSGIRRYIFWGSRYGSSEGGKKGGQQRGRIQQDPMTDPSAQGRPRTAVSRIWANRELPTQTTTVSDGSLKAAATEVDLENGLNHLKAWSLPEIADRRSAIISMPVFDS